MSVISRNIPAPLFIKIESGAFGQLKKILKENHIEFDKPLIITEQKVLDLGGKKIVELFSEHDIHLAKDNSISEAEKIVKNLKIKNNDAVICIGGGRILDLGKYAATKAKLNYISIPTSPSNDGLASPVAVLKNNKGLTESLGVNMPMGILVDLDVMKSAPIDNIKAGTGDLLSNFSALEDWKLAYNENKEKMDDFAASLAYSAADLMYGKFAGCQKVELDEEKFLKTLVNGLILSGIAMNIAGSSRPCSGAEHEISHAIDKLYPGKSMHGLQVSLGILISEKLRGNDFENYKRFFELIGLPTQAKDIGLTDDELVKTLELAPKTRPDRYTILEEKNLDKNKIIELVKSL